MTDEPSNPLNALIADADLREIEKFLLVGDADLREIERYLLVADADPRTMEKDLEASPSEGDLYALDGLRALTNMDDIDVSDADRRLYERMTTTVLTPKTPEQKARQMIEEALRLNAKIQKKMHPRSNNKKRH
jgi:hypothetical protein